MKHPGSRPAKPVKSRQKSARKGARIPRAGAPESGIWLWGTHAVRAALANPARAHLRLVASENAARRLPEAARPELVGPPALAALLPDGAVHQGLALLTRPLPGPKLDNILHAPKGVLVMLDGVTDPRNIGAIFRAAAAFGASAVIAQARHMPPLGGVLAKAAAGAIETVPCCPAVNLSRTLEQLAAAGWFSIGLTGDTRTGIARAVSNTDRLCLVLGAEGKGLRPNVAKHCDLLARIPIAPDMESLNVATAAAIALYEAGRR